MICSGLPAVSCASAPRCTTTAQPAAARFTWLGVEKIIAVNAVEAHDVIPEIRQMACYRDTDVAAMASDQDAHANMLSRPGPSRGPGSWRGVAAVAKQAAQGEVVSTHRGPVRRRSPPVACRGTIET